MRAVQCARRAAGLHARVLAAPGCSLVDLRSRHIAAEQDAPQAPPTCDWQPRGLGRSFAAAATSCDVRARTQPLRSFSTAAPSEPGEAPPVPPGEEEPESARIYEGGLAVTVRRVKLLSLASLLLTVVGAPLLVQLSTPEAVSVAVKATITASLVGFGCFTTALLQWFASPYILRLVLEGDQVTVTTLNVFAQPFQTRFQIQEMREPQTMRPLASFQVDGRIYFIDGNTADERLLGKLGLKKAVHKQPLEEDDD